MVDTVCSKCGNKVYRPIINIYLREVIDCKEVTLEIDFFCNYCHNLLSRHDITLDEENYPNFYESLEVLV